MSGSASPSLIYGFGTACYTPRVGLGGGSREAPTFSCALAADCLVCRALLHQK